MHAKTLAWTSHCVSEVSMGWYRQRQSALAAICARLKNYEHYYVELQHINLPRRRAECPFQVSPVRVTFAVSAAKVTLGWVRKRKQSFPRSLDQGVYYENLFLCSPLDSIPSPLIERVARRRLVGKKHKDILVAGRTHDPAFPLVQILLGRSN